VTLPVPCESNLPFPSLRTTHHTNNLSPHTHTHTHKNTYINTNIRRHERIPQHGRPPDAALHQGPPGRRVLSCHSGVEAERYRSGIYRNCQYLSLFLTSTYYNEEIDKDFILEKIVEILLCFALLCFALLCFALLGYYLIYYYSKDNGLHSAFIYFNHSIQLTQICSILIERSWMLLIPAVSLTIFNTTQFLALEHVFSVHSSSFRVIPIFIFIAV
jgi:hypothetical protein